MSANLLGSLDGYSRFVAELLDRPDVLIPASNISFARPNLPALIKEIEALLVQNSRDELRTPDVK